MPHQVAFADNKYYYAMGGARPGDRISAMLVKSYSKGLNIKSALETEW